MAGNEMCCGDAPGECCAGECVHCRHKATPRDEQLKRSMLNRLSRIIGQLGGVKKMTIEGNTISGVDADGNEVFRHTYSPMNLENENGFIFYQTEDADAGQFTYFAFSPDTMEDTWHLEFRYAEKVEDLMSWFEGAYAYWNVGAIAEDYTEEEITGAITLFGTENLSGEAE